MKIKTQKTITEEVEIDLPDYFSHDLYVYMHRDGLFTRVYIGSGKDYANITTAPQMANHDKLETILPLTREQFYEKFTKAIELMTGFKYDDAINHSHAGAVEKDLELVKENGHEREQFEL